MKSRSPWAVGQVLAMAGVLLGSSGNVWADVWGYIDAKGVAHFAAERVDERYELFFRGNNVPDPSRGAPESAPATPRPVAVPTAPPKLIAFFEVSPQYRQVKHHVREASRQYRIDYVVSTLKDRVAKLRELSPLWEMYQDGVDISTIQWTAH